MTYRRKLSHNELKDVKEDVLQEESSPRTELLPVSTGGIEAVKRIFPRKEDGTLSDEMDDLVRFSFGAFILGAVYGGLPASSLLRSRYIEKSQAEVYLHRVDAARQSQHAGVRGLIRYGWRWGWRVALLSGMFQGCSLCFAVYRNKADLWNYAAAAGVTASLYKMPLGPKGMLAGGIIGAVCGIPLGFSFVSLEKLKGENILEKYRRRKEEVLVSEENEFKSASEFLDLALDTVGKDMVESELAASSSTSSSPQDS